MKITINIIKKHLFVFILLILISAGIFIAFAYNSDSKNKKYSSPAIFGHSADEVEVNINGETKTLQEALDFLTERINNPNSNNLEFIGSFRGLNYAYTLPLRYIGEKEYKYIVIADVHGGGGNERLTFHIGDKLVLEERVEIQGITLSYLPRDAKTRLQINIDRGDIPSIGFSWLCVPGGCKSQHAPYTDDIWVYRISKDQKFEQFSFPDVNYTYTIE